MTFFNKFNIQLKFKVKIQFYFKHFLKSSHVRQKKHNVPLLINLQYA